MAIHPANEAPRLSASSLRRKWLINLSADQIMELPAEAYCKIILRLWMESGQKLKLQEKWRYDV